MHTLEQELHRGKELGRALHETFKVEGGVLIKDTILNIICFLPLTFSKFQPIAQIGTLMVLTLVLALIGTLFIMPAFFKFCVHSEHFGSAHLKAA